MKTQLKFYLYLACSFAGLVSAFYFNSLAITHGEDYFAIWTGTAASQVLTWDLLIVAVSGVIFMFVEAKRIGMKSIWWFVLLACITAMACAFPLFLAIREKHLTKSRLSVSA